MMKCPLGNHRLHTGPYAPEHWVRSREALRHHLNVVHHMDYKAVRQPDSTLQDECFPLKAARLSRRTRRHEMYRRPEKTGVQPQPPAGPVPLLSLKSSRLSSTSFRSTPCGTPLHPPSIVRPLVSTSSRPRDLPSEETPSNEPVPLLSLRFHPQTSVASSNSQVRVKSNSTRFTSKSKSAKTA